MSGRSSFHPQSDIRQTVLDALYRTCSYPSFLDKSCRAANDPIADIARSKYAPAMRCYSLLVHGVLDWSAGAVEKWQIPETRPSGFYYHRHVFASSSDHAIGKVLVDMRFHYKDTTDWFINDLLDLILEVEEIKTAPFYKGLIKDNLGAAFYP